MGRAGKTRRHDHKMKAKRAAKVAKRAAYAALRGTSKKSKKIKARASNAFSNAKHRHLIDNCGNIGCARCFPQFARRIGSNFT